MSERDGEGRQESADGAEQIRGALHDVSNALTVLLGWVAEARSPDMAPEDVRAALRVVEIHAQKARDLARDAIGGAPLKPSAAPCESVVDEVLAGLAMAARDAGVTLVLDGSAGQATVESATALHHVLVNLLLNALGFAPRGSTVWVALHPTADTVAIDVTDEGAGIPEAARASIFSGVSGREGGAGIGLVHSRKIARGAAGDLVLLPSAKGTTFRVTWPRSDHAPQPSGASVRGGSSLAGRRLLVVEDDPAVLALLDAALGARGAEVVQVASRAELAAALATPHDGAILDLSPLEGHVREDFARVAAAARPGAPLILATGSVDRLPDELAGSAPVSLVRKPFELGELFAALLAGRSSEPASR